MQPAPRSQRPMVTLTTFKSLEEGQSLFDFDRPINEENFIINSTSLIYRNKAAQQGRNKNVSVVSKENAMSGDMPDFSSDMVFSLDIQQDDKEVSYFLQKPQILSLISEITPSTLKQLPFVCLNNHGRANEVKSAKINEGDVIRIGKNYLKVLETHLSQHSDSTLSNSVPTLLCDPVSSESQDPPLAKTCRICLMEDPQGLISPCKCKGSCKYIHLDCLKTWLQNKVTRQENRLVSSYLLSKFQCELCKQPLPNKIISEGKANQFVEFHRPDEPYLILQRLQEDSRDKTIYVLTPKDQGVHIGRGNQSDIRFNDLMISRKHSLIQVRNGGFYLSDQGSKFGTLLLLQEQKRFDRMLCLQLHNKVYKFEVFPSVRPRAYSYL